MLRECATYDLRVNICQTVEGFSGNKDSDVHTAEARDGGVNTQSKVRFHAEPSCNFQDLVPETEIFFRTAR